MRRSPRAATDFTSNLAIMLSGRTALIAVAGYAHFSPSDRGLAAHVALQFVNWRCLWPAHDVERDGLVRVTHSQGTGPQDRGSPH
jgi:hypothetical protein